MVTCDVFPVSSRTTASMKASRGLLPRTSWLTMAGALRQAVFRFCSVIGSLWVSRALAFAILVLTFLILVVCLVLLFLRLAELVVVVVDEPLALGLAGTLLVGADHVPLAFRRLDLIRDHNPTD